MKRFLIDTNIIVDYVLKREPFFTNSEFILDSCANNIIKGFIAYHSIPNLWYILRKYCSTNERRKILLSICGFLTVIASDHESVIAAIKNENINDFEDALQISCGNEAKVDYIVTRNIGDFSESDIDVISPDIAVKKIKDLLSSQL